MHGGSGLAFFPKTFVESLDGVGEIRRSVSRAMSFQKVQLTSETEGYGIEIETIVHTGRPAQQDSAHEALSP